MWKHLSPDVTVINNGIDPADFIDLQIEGNRRVNKDRIFIRHLGAIYGAREGILKQFINSLDAYCMKNLIKNTINIELIGFVPKNVLSKKLGSPNIVLQQFENVTYTEALHLEKSADILLLIIGVHSSSNAEVSSKIFEYIYSQRPILIIGKSQQLEDMLSDRKSVMIIGDTINEQDIENVFSWYLNLDHTIILDDFKILSKHIEETFNRREHAKELANLFDKIMMSKFDAS